MAGSFRVNQKYPFFFQQFHAFGVFEYNNNFVQNVELLLNNMK